MRKHLMLVAMVVLGIVGAAAFHARAEEKDEGKEGNEQKVAFDKAPAAVQKTLTDEAKGNKIETVDKETEDGKTVYEADVKIGGKNYEIKVAEDGTLISKKLDQEDEEKGAKKGEKEEDEKNEKK